MRSPEEISASLQLLAELSELNGENEFKTRAIRNAAEICSHFIGSTKELLSQIADPGIPKIGKNLAQKISTYAELARDPELEDLCKLVPPTVLEMRRVPGLGAKKVKILWEELRLDGLQSLEQACRENRLLKLKGFGEKMQQKILEGIEVLKRYQGLMLLSRAEYLGRLVCSMIQEQTPEELVAVTGELRRKCEVVRQVEVITSATLNATLRKLFEDSGIFNLKKGEDESFSFTTTLGETVRIFHSSRDQFAKTLLVSTGPYEFVAQLNLSEKVSGDDEEKIFVEIGRDYVIPERREAELLADRSFNPGEGSVVSIADIKGIVHCHSTYSDGVNELKDMALAAKGKGFEYLGIADHSVSARYAGGLTIDKIDRQHAEIEKLNEELAPFRIFKGIESDITADGDLDYDVVTLKRFDFVIASIHNRFDMSREEMTARVVKALKNPFTKILAHPSGRLLLEREAYAIDYEQVIEVAVGQKVALEINASPHRLDLDWRWVDYARKKGAIFSVNPDAHRITRFDDIRFGVAMARKGGLGKERVVTCKPAGDFLASLKS